MRNGAIVIEGHVQGLSNTRSLGELGITVYVLDVNTCLAQHSKYCNKFIKCPPFRSKEFIDFLVHLGSSEHMEGWLLIASNDHIVENISRNSERLSQYYRMLVPPIGTIDRIINKKSLLEIARSCGTHTPETCYSDNIDLARRFRYPLLVKGNHGLSFYKATHLKAIEVSDFDELVEIVQNLCKQIPAEDIMIQELIPENNGNEVVSFTCFAIDGTIKAFWMGRKLREHPIKYGTGTYAQSIFAPEVTEEARPLVDALQYTGVCEIEFIRDSRDGLYKLIEINPRTWLWVGLAKACGVDYAKMMYRHTQGMEQSFPDSYTINTKWINRLTDTVFAIEAIVKGKIKLIDYLSSLRGEKISAIWSWEDPIPGILFPFMSFTIARKRL